MNVNLDVTKQVRELIDWIEGKLKGAVISGKRDKLERIINTISDLIRNKKIYLTNIRIAAKMGDGIRRDVEIKKALEIAKNDTEKLKTSIDDIGLKDSDIYKVLNTKIAVLANEKMNLIERFMNIQEGIDAKVSNEEIIAALVSYESKWDDISNELEKIKKELSSK
jgi:hypothetical protein